ncbi:hypothetical protein [Halobaculum sp. D14]|uniref:DUF7859 family protein n=1 Tax=unclassified Halobaculum TaxID=2640896 RepID=UPI003EB76B7C
MGVLDVVGEAAAQNPILTGILVVIVLLLLGAYLFVRRIFVSAREGYEQGKQ